MTKLERQAKNEVLNILREEGYPTYARLLNMFDVNLTSDPGVVGYMEPSKGRIVLNKGLDIEQVSVIARHEILHEYLTHEMRLLKHLAQSMDLDYDTLDDIRVKDLKNDLYKNKNFNIAADYEISNRGYTDADKETIRNIKLNGKTLSGLVTEDEHPDWTNMSVEQMYDELNELMQQQNQQMQQQNQQQNQQGQQGDQSEDSADGNSGDSSPQIGDRGDSAIQQAEEIARRAEKIAEKAKEAKKEQGDDSGEGSSSSGSSEDVEDEEGDSESSGSGSDSDMGDGSESSGEGDGESDDGESGDGDGGSGSPLDDLESNAEKLSDAAGDLADDMKSHGGPGEGNVFDTPEERAAKADEAARLEKIKRMFNDLQTQSEILDETEEVVRKEQRIKADRKAAQYRSSPLQSFKLSLEGFIKNQISVQKGLSWSKINKTYANSKVMKPGRTRMTQGKIPVINVYFDQSGSWGPNDIKIGEQAIATLNKYVRQGEIQINVFYFDTEVSGNREDMWHGGTNLDPVIKHVNSTKPDNVIIMTDGDGDWTTYSSSATVPGAVWFLWRNSVSEKLKQHLKGKQLTKSFELK